MIIKINMKRRVIADIIIKVVKRSQIMGVVDAEGGHGVKKHKIRKKKKKFFLIRR
jgi:hypothetical protein